MTSATSDNSSFFYEISQQFRERIKVGHRVILVIEWNEQIINSSKQDHEALIRGLQSLISVYFDEWISLGCPSLASPEQFFSRNQWNFVVISHEIKTLQPLLSDTFKGLPVSLRYFSPIEFTEIALGQTIHFMIYDLRNGAHPNTMGRILETISGSGFLLIFCRSLEEYWTLIDPSVHDFVLQFPHQLDEIKPIFFPYLRKSLENLKPITMKDLVSLGLKTRFTMKKSISLPLADNIQSDLASRNIKWLSLDATFKDYPVTKDQQEALTFLNDIVAKTISSRKRPRLGRAVFISSKRGRGKSTVLGLCIGATILESLPSRPHVITAPQVENVQVVFHSILSFLRLKGIESRAELDEDTRMIRGITVGKRLVLRYRDPIDVLKEKGSVLMVDEAGSIPIPLLKHFFKKFALIIFSSTEHGYEGTGRSFTFRFQKELEADNRLLAKLVLDQPVRHSVDDPLESWLHEVLLLEAEPPELTINREMLDLEKLELVHFDKKKLFFDDVDMLRDIIGILVSSHYRNQPNDLFLMADAPHIHVYGVFYRDLENKMEMEFVNEDKMQCARERVLVSAILVSIEGGFDPARIPVDPIQQRELRGNVVSLTMYRTVNFDFPRWKGARIVRIAVHPQYQDQGIGSRSLQLFELECHGQQFEWIGTSFGGTPELINFWIKNSYRAVHIRPTPSTTTGECSVIMIKTLVPELESLIREASKDLRLHILHWTRELWWYFEPEEILAFIEATDPYHDWKPAITEIGIYRLNNYLNRVLTFFGAMGVINQLAWSYFLKYPEAGVHLAPIQRKILVVKNLQGWDWNSVAARFRTDPSKIQGLYVKSLKRLRKWFLTEVRQ